MNVKIAGALRQVLPVKRQPCERLASRDRAGEDPPNCCHAPIVVVAKRRNQHLEWCLGVHFGSRDVLQDGLEERLEISSKLGRQSRLCGGGLGIDDRKIRLLLSSAQFNEQVEGIVEHASWLC